MFISFNKGPAGTGKVTQSNLLYEFLKNKYNKGVFLSSIYKGLNKKKNLILLIK